jgi:hypothetical protein
MGMGMGKNKNENEKRIRMGGSWGVGELGSWGVEEERKEERFRGKKRGILIQRAKWPLRPI